MSLRIYGNRPLKMLPGLETRPTLAVVRQALFNIWRGRILGSTWLDLCAGSGAIGAEALCRGAVRVVGIEHSDLACTILQQNWQQVAKETQKFQVLRGDVIQKLKRLQGQRFDRIYFDPPYAGDLYEPVLRAIADYELLAAGGELAVEHSPKRLDLPLPPTLEVCRQKVYGNTALTFYCPAPGLAAAGED